MPPMDAVQIACVQTSYAKLAPQINEFAKTFYVRLFEKNPNIKLMFRGDQSEQEIKLGNMLSAAVNGLNRVGGVGSTLVGLGQRHRHYGVRSSDYVLFGEALYWTLARYLGDMWTRETEIAWGEFYRLLVDDMQGTIPAKTSEERRVVT